MKLEFARGVFLIGALGVTSLCVAAWNEPRANVVRSSDSYSSCPLPPSARSVQTQLRLDGELLLLLYGLSQSLGSRG
ncbi:hypothetical protein N8H22_06725 [Stutzerimonas stutzeri]|uniref:hypothetical protein n=1 Tax=Stutzerimonas sp. S1 TaxID=3030652 RepID=UPI00222433DE|nr:hypothetical protein [Stutzerimonas sp. S1]MCW3148298.1 hypothetical protein [Stutzerimonas sp. S1]